MGAKHALAAHHGLHARQKLARLKGLGQVIVGAHFQAQDAIHRIAARGEHEDGDGLACGAQAPAQRQAILARHHDVEHQHVEALARQQPGGAGRIAHRTHLQALLAQIALQQGAQFGLVVGDQDAGGVTHGAGWVQGRGGCGWVPMVSGRSAHGLRKHDKA